MSSLYQKPFKSIDQQVELLRSRGLQFSDPERLAHILQAVGYYRLSGYWHDFREPAPEGGKRPSTFVAGTSLSEVMEIYEFDEDLRSLLVKGLSRIEVSLRFKIGHLLGRRNQFAHNDLSFLSSEWGENKKTLSVPPETGAVTLREYNDHNDWVKKQIQGERVSNEAFVAHIYDSYGQPLPVWTATEVMTFGHLNKLFYGMKQQDRQEVAVGFDVFGEDGTGDARSFSSWLERLRQTRNYCSHYSRLWNKNNTAPIAVPYSCEELQHITASSGSDSEGAPVSRANSRIYATVALLTYLLARIDYTNDIRDEIIGRILNFAQGRTDRLQAMGFPPDWDKNSIWSTGYSRNSERSDRGRLLRSVHLMYKLDASKQITFKSSAKEQKSYINYMRKNGALLSVPGSNSHRFPSFQFDSSTGNVSKTVAIANRRLLNGAEGAEEDRWNALEWWVSDSGHVPGKSPKDLLESGKLDDVLDSMLEPLNDE